MESKYEVICADIDSRKEELAELVLRLANTYAPVGREMDVASVVHEWYQQNDVRSELVEIIEGRACVVGRLRGSGGGKSLIFNAHLDTEVSGPDHLNLMKDADVNTIGAWREGDKIFGHTAINDRHAHALFMFAARAVRDAQVDLRGDVYLTSVAGETGQTPVDEYQGLQYDGKGWGSSYLVEHGVYADYAIVSETTDFALNWYSCGAAYYKITLNGVNMYTPRMIRSSTVRESPNAILKASYVVQAVERWAEEFTRSRTGMTVCGEVRPNAQVGAIRGGIPWRPNRSSPYAAIYVDVRTLPGESPLVITEELRRVVESVDPEAEVELIMSKSGSIGVGIEPLADAIRSAHQYVRAEPIPEHAEPAVLSMWRDTNVFNKAGIPAINYGPGRASAAVQGTGHLTLQELLDVAKVYALTILSICT